MRFRVLLLLTGCDIVFSTDRVPEPPPCDEVGHDEDGDGIDDGCDPCPFSSENDGDEDEDGLALACDPDPLVANEVLLFSGFEAGTRSHFQPSEGLFSADEFRVTGNGSAYLAWNEPLPAAGVWIITRVSVETLNTGNAWREIGFVFDATATSAMNQYNGTHCVAGRTTGDYTEVFFRERPLNDDVITHNASPGITIVGYDGIMRGAYAHDATPAAACTFSTGGLDANISGTQTPPPPAGTVALYATTVDASFYFVLIATK